jgi:hypothetical protein
VDVAVAYQDSICMVATWKSFVFPVMGSKALPVESARQQVRALTNFAKKLGPGKLAEMTLIAPDAPFPGAEARAAFDAAVPIVSPYYGCVSAVFEGTGFRAAMVRAFVASFQMLSRTKYPQKVFATADEAAAWMFPHTKPMGMDIASAAEIAAAAHAIRDIAVARGIFTSSSAATASPA